VRIVTSLARVWAGRSESHRAHQLIGSTLNGFTEGFETADLKHARLLQRQLEGRVEPC
jgi:adenylate cyclase